MAGITLGSDRVALYTGLDLGFGFVDEVGCIHCTLHCQYMAGKTKACFIPEFVVLFLVAAGANDRCR